MSKATNKQHARLNTQQSQQLTIYNQESRQPRQSLCVCVCVRVRSFAVVAAPSPKAKAPARRDAMPPRSGNCAATGRKPAVAWCEALDAALRISGGERRLDVEVGGGDVGDEW